MEYSFIKHVIILSVSWNLVVQAAEPENKVTTDDYARAERFLPWNADKYVLNGNVIHHWIGDSDRFWYKRQTKGGGKEFVLVHAADGEKQAAFNHETIAAGLTAAIGEKIDPTNLPFSDFRYVDDENAIEIVVRKKKWHCEVLAEYCVEVPAGPGPSNLISPDGRWAAFLKGPNLWSRSLKTGEEQALTSDGEERFAYGAAGGTSLVKLTMERKGKVMPPMAIWSPDSQKLVVQKLDERKVPDSYLLQNAPEDGSVRPILYRYPYSLPIDTHRPSADIYIIDIPSGETIKVQYESLPAANYGPVSGGAWWSKDSKYIYVVPMEEGIKRRRLLRIDSTNGRVKTLIEEESDTFIDDGWNILGRDPVKTLTTGEIVWSSERDGWNHLYLYDSNGQLVRQLTDGAWAVRTVIYINEESRDIYFTANGRETEEDIYFQYLYSVNMDSGELRLTTPENADHTLTTINHNPIRHLIHPNTSGSSNASFSPSGRYFIESYSRIDMPTITVLRNASGGKISTLEVADISALNDVDNLFPEPFEVLASDDVTPIYGNIYRPSNFDPTQTYPVIDAIYPGPGVIRTRKDFMGAMFDDAHALAELGFVVLTIDGRGTAYRSKAFIDDVYGNFEKAGNLEDHIAAIKQLAEKYSYMDINRVGIYGYSGGGYASARAILKYPDFYKVAVSASGNHDQRGYQIGWGPRYAGLYDKQDNNYEKHVNSKLANNLKGKLFLIHGELDENVHPSLTIQLVDALIKANKDFDFLILPNTGHIYGAGVYGTYYYRRQWDYFVRYLLGREPPENYKITGE